MFKYRAFKSFKRKIKVFFFFFGRLSCYLKHWNSKNCLSWLKCSTTSLKPFDTSSVKSKNLIQNLDWTMALPSALCLLCGLMLYNSLTACNSTLALNIPTHHSKFHEFLHYSLFVFKCDAVLGQTSKHDDYIWRCEFVYF